MKIAKRYLLLVAALGFCYLATTTDSDTIQAHSRRNIEQSRFGILFRQVYNNPGAKIYRNGEGRTANYKDTLDIGDGMLYVVEGKARDINPVNVRNVGDAKHVEKWLGKYKIRVRYKCLKDEGDLPVIS